MTPHEIQLLWWLVPLTGGWAGRWVYEKWIKSHDECADCVDIGYERGWVDCDRRRATLEDWTERTLEVERQRAHLASVMLEEAAGEPELAGHTVYPQLAPEALAAEDVPRPGQGVAYPVRDAYPAPETGEQPPSAWLGHPDEAGDDTLTRTYIAQGGWERDQRSIGATGQSLWFLAWQQRQAAA